MLANIWFLSTLLSRRRELKELWRKVVEAIPEMVSSGERFQNGSQKVKIPLALPSNLCA
jgi:hypothetical protein